MKTRTLRRLFALTFVLGQAGVACAAQEGAQRVIATYVHAHQAEAIELLQRAVDINSGTLNFDGVRKVAALFRPQFKALGFRTRWIDGAAFHRAGHLIAERPGVGPRILLIGHLDTVFEKSSPFQRFRRVNENIADEPGTSDMKGGIVVGLYALRALAAVHALAHLNVTFMLMGDEEDVGEPVRLARAALIKAGSNADVAIGLENGDDDPHTAITARRGASDWTLKTGGNSAHSSQIFSPEVSAGAVYEMARILGDFYTDLRGERYLTFNPGIVLGGVQVSFDPGKWMGTASGKSNIVVPDSIVVGDLRTISVDQRERAETRMREIVSRHLPGTTATITFDNGYPPMAPTDGNRRLLKMYDRASRDLGFGPVTAVDPMNAGAADISFVADEAKMALGGLGLLGGGNHTVKEYADLRTFPIQAQRLALLLYRLSLHCEPCRSR